MASRSVSLWIDQLKAGDRAATEKLWERYFQRLIGLARKRLENRARLGSDAEDVALSAFDSFFRGAEAGRFPQLHDRDELWHLLVTITARKAQRLVRDQSRQKRGGGQVLGESAIVMFDDLGQEQAGLDFAMSDAPNPEFAAQLADEYQRLFDQLDDPDLRTIAIMKLEGHTIAEMSAKLNRLPSSVERKLKVIRAVWEKELSGPAENVM